MRTKCIELDYDSHPSELVDPGIVDPKISVQQLREKIPPHCFQPSHAKSFYYLFRDVAFAAVLALGAHRGIPMIASLYLRIIVWVLYGYAQGLVMTGLWVLGHECGHMNFSPSSTLNDAVGFLLHSFLLTPYFSWKSSHRRHHIYANNMKKDHNYVPPTRGDYAESLFVDVEHLEELTEDAPFVTLLRILIQQIFGFPWYLITNITAAPGSLHRKQSNTLLGNSHLLPSSTLFRPEESNLILISDLGILTMAFFLRYCTHLVGTPTLLLLYGQGYAWMNHWIVAITYLHHTHPNLPKYDDEAWTFLRGATATVDRDFGWIGRNLFHNIIDYHVVHHLFSRIPFYHTEEATEAIVPLLGDYYHSDKGNSFILGLWISFTKCQWVEPRNSSAEPRDRILWYKGGPSPPPETSMGSKDWCF
ncbi:delta-12 fatty acid desaturas-like protein [Corynespora cassiicola Philippines]|uniref:Delta-12 fatty acid desaturas-like protein n=1 Tax=Corynespora cassiicola Philippines TaxID=1448308 RepID=A0A2T2N9X2_CORCC|nr:delta-12 fatty acid desaturas-like protein [Corynespora cassiicola Philippines]